MSGRRSIGKLSEEAPRVETIKSVNNIPSTILIGKKLVWLRIYYLCITSYCSLYQIQYKL